jgi:hypothetical protein
MRQGVPRYLAVLVFLAGMLAVICTAPPGVSVPSASAQGNSPGDEEEPPAAEEPPREEPRKKAPVPAGAAAQTTKKAIWGMPSHNGISLFSRYRDLGVGIFQTQAHWDEIAPLTRPADPANPADPAYRWPRYLEREIEEAESHDMKVAIQLIGTPPWANGWRSWQLTPALPSEFGHFATAIARRYPTVDLWMIWGEANRSGNFRPNSGARPEARKLRRKQRRAPENYAALVDAAYGALKAVDAGNKVIGGATYFSGGKREKIIRPYPWIRYMRLADGSRPRMDMWSHNPYSYRKPNLKNPPSPKGRVDFSDLRRLARALDRAFPQELPLFLSEFGVPTARDLDFKFFVDARTSRRWVRAAMRIVRNWDRIYTLGWSVPVDTRRNPQGLMTNELNPKPAYIAFKAG